MTADRVLDASVVQAALFDALEPVQRECDAVLRSRPTARARLRYAVKVTPLQIIVSMAPDEGRPGGRLVALFSGAKLPDGGAALREAVDEVVGGIMSSASLEAQAAIIATAIENPAGGLYLLVNPGEATADLALSLDGGDMGRGIWIGTLGPAPETVH